MGGGGVCLRSDTPERQRKLSPYFCLLPKCSLFCLFRELRFLAFPSCGSAVAVAFVPRLSSPIASHILLLWPGPEGQLVKGKYDFFLLLLVFILLFLVSSKMCFKRQPYIKQANTFTPCPINQPMPNPCASYGGMLWLSFQIACWNWWNRCTPCGFFSQQSPGNSFQNTHLREAIKAPQRCRNQFVRNNKFFPVIHGVMRVFRC